MRWDSLRLDSSETGSAGYAVLPLIERGAVARTFDTPEFRGMTFYEVQAKSIVSEVPKSSRMMFRYTINPYRGCIHACKYCFARNSHTYLDLDAGRDFDTKVVVKVNAPQLLRAGADCLAVISDLFDAPDVAERARSYGKLFLHDVAQ